MHSRAGISRYRLGVVALALVALAGVSPGAAQENGGAQQRAPAMHSHAGHGPSAQQPHGQISGRHEAMEMGHGGIRFYMTTDATPARTPPEPERAHYAVPEDITLQDQDGRVVNLAALLAERRPVVMQFIFTSCATICPVLTAGMASAQGAFVERAPDVLILSISIDPTYDTPARLKAYAARYHAGANWRFLTGSEPMIRRTIAAFDALLRSDNKMYHRPYTYFRSRDGMWLRANQLLSRDGMVALFERALDAAPAADAAVRNAPPAGDQG